MFGARVFGTKGIELTNLDTCDHDTFELFLENTDTVVLWSHEIKEFNTFVQCTDIKPRDNLSDLWDNYKRTNTAMCALYSHTNDTKRPTNS